MTREDAIKYQQEYENTHKPMPKDLKLTNELADKINNFISEHIKDTLDRQKRGYEPYANFYLLGENGYVSTISEDKLPLKEIATHVSLKTEHNWDRIYTVLFNRYKVDTKTPILKLPIFSGIDKNNKEIDWSLKRYLYYPGEPDISSYSDGKAKHYEQGPIYVEEEDKSYYISTESVHFKDMISHPYKNMYIGDLEDLSCFIDYITTNEKNLDNEHLIGEVLYGKNIDKCFLYDWQKAYLQEFMETYQSKKRDIEDHFEKRYNKHIVDKTDLLTITAKEMPALSLDYKLTDIKYMSDENQNFISTKLIWEEKDLNKIYPDVYLNFILDVNDENKMEVTPEINIVKDEVYHFNHSFEICVKEHEEHAFNEFFRSYGVDIKEFINYIYDTYGEICFDHDIAINDLEDFKDTLEPTFNFQI